MGNTNKTSLLSHSELLSPVDESLSFLTKWKKQQIASIHSKYLLHYPSKIYIQFSEFSKVCAKSPVEFHLDRLLKVFSNSKNTINMLEFLSIVITYSEIAWKNKVTLLFQVFDFDKSKTLTKDEIAIMSRCFYKGIQIATGNRFQLPFTLETYKTQENFFPEISSSEGILLPNVIKWVEKQRNLISLLQMYTVKEDSPERVISRTFDRRDTNKSHRKNSVSATRSPFYPVKEKRRSAIENLFYSACNRSKKAQAGVLYQQLCKSPIFHSYAEAFFGIFHLNLKAELTISDFVNVYKRIKHLRHLKFLEDQRRPSKRHSRFNSSDQADQYRVSPNILKKLFDKYDINHDGFVDFSELKLALNDLFSKKTIEDLFNSYDSDKNRMLDIHEFFKLFSLNKSKSPLV